MPILIHNSQEKEITDSELVILMKNKLVTPVADDNLIVKPDKPGVWNEIKRILKRARS